jgi:mannosyltransferase OCH1-like enzyme
MATLTLFALFLWAANVKADAAHNQGHQQGSETTARELHAASQPVLPTKGLPPVPALYPGGKQIPSTIWIAVKSRDDEMDPHIKELFQRNPTWTPQICDNKCKDDFMGSVWEGTSANWAYNMVNPLIGASRADIWRYCTLYTYGGMYMDDDSNIAHSLDSV